LLRSDHEIDRIRSVGLRWMIEPANPVLLLVDRCGR